MEQTVCSPSKAPASPLWQRRRARERAPLTPLTLSISQETCIPCPRTASSSLRLATEFLVVGTIGQGTTSFVQHAIRLSDGRNVALKTLRTDDEEMVELAKKEYEMLKTVEHPNVVRALDFIVAPDRAVVVLDFFDGPDLLETIGSMPERCLPEHVATPLISQLTDAVAYLHVQRVVHRDIKPQNVLVSKDLKELRLVDFNVSRCLKGGLSLTPTGTRLYAAPEVLLGDAPSELSDIWAVGLCAHLLLSGKLPQDRDRACARKVPLQDCAKKQVLLRGPRWANVSEQCKAMLRRLLASEPAERLLPAALLPECGQGTRCSARASSWPTSVHTSARHRVEADGHKRQRSSQELASFASCSSRVCLTDLESPSTFSSKSTASSGGSGRSHETWVSVVEL